MERQRQIELMESRARRATAIAQRVLDDQSVREIVTQRTDDRPRHEFKEEDLDVKYA